MPSSSRKKAKGKARKKAAAAAARQQEIPRSNIVGTWLSQQSAEINGCRHGCSLLPEGHDVSKLIKTFYECWDDASHDRLTGEIVVEAIKKTHNKYPGVWSDRTNRELATARLVSDGTHLLLSGVDAGKHIAGAVAVAIHCLPANGCLDLSSKLKIVDMLEGCERSVLQFYSKRIPCSCLDDKYSRSKSKPKVGVCFHCKQRKEHCKLMVCARCKSAQYCSQKCQALDWPSHKEDDYCKSMSAER